MYAYLCGLIQNMFFFFSLDKAKLVPMVNVAGSAGGTTIVIKSKARTIIRCQASLYGQPQSNTEEIEPILT